MKVSEQLLMSFSIDLNYLEEILAELSPEEANLYKENLHEVLNSLLSAQTRLTGLLRLEPKTCQCGVNSDGTSA